MFLVLCSWFLVLGLVVLSDRRRERSAEFRKAEGGGAGFVLGSLFLVPCSWFLVPCSLFLGPGSIAAGSEAVEAKRDALGRRPGGVVNAGVNFGGRINSDGVNCLRQTGTVSAGSTKLR